MIWPQNNEAVKASFDKDIRDQHLTYNYDAINEKTGEAEKWLYEMHFYDENRINCEYCPCLQVESMKRELRSGSSNLEGSLSLICQTILVR